MVQTTLHLKKQNFKFSAAHFLIFDEFSAEKLHGHNYQVSLDMTFSQDHLMQSQGYAVDFNILKKFIKSRLDFWDEHVLIPSLHPEMKVQKSSVFKNYEIHFRDRFYSLPIDETHLLPLNNTSVENLSALLAKDFMDEFQKYHVIQIQVYVEETRGQTASATIKI